MKPKVFLTHLIFRVITYSKAVFWLDAYKKALYISPQYHYLEALDQFGSLIG